MNLKKPRPPRLRVQRCLYPTALDGFEFVLCHFARDEPGDIYSLDLTAMPTM